MYKRQSRGTQNASAMFSNDQLIGYVNITYKDNPNLKDKTNREGLMEVGNAYLDFVAMIQCLSLIHLSQSRDNYYSRTFK